jgi:excinuclease ABC subunit A
MMDKLTIRGAREHNLKNIDLEIPRDRLVVITGLSGSGKSSLAFDTIYAEGQRRYVESLSAYARQFLGLMEKPDLDFIDGLSPAIAIEQRAASKNPRSTVGTVTEIHDYLRLLFARIGRPHCPKCGQPIASQTVQQITDAILEQPEGTKLAILAPLIQSRKGEYRELFDKLRREGFVRVRIDKKLYDIDALPVLDKNKKHAIDAVVDRMTISPKSQKRIADSLEVALKLSEGLVAAIYNDKQEVLYSEKLSCTKCHISLGELSPRMFSFNSPFGACPACSGLGTKMEIDPEALVHNPELTVNQGAISHYGDPMGHWIGSHLEAVAKAYSFSLDEPWGKMSQKNRDILLYGTDKAVNIRYQSASNDNVYQYTKKFEGIIPMMMRRYHQTDSDYVRYEVEKFMSILPCPVCLGARLKPESLAVKVAGRSINEMSKLSVKNSRLFFGSELKLSDKEKTIAKQVLKEINSRLGFLTDVGLDYLSLDRHSESLSGGEAQRIHLATQIGSGLTGVLYVLDEPSIGLHPRDNSRLLATLKRLRDLGNTLVVVEHDEETIRSADWIVDLGPGAGVHGGHVVAQGTLADILREPKSLTGAFLSGKTAPSPRPPLRRPSGHLLVKGARQFNLKGIDVDIPLGLLVCVTGVSGSGKSTLVHEVLYKALARRLYGAKDEPGAHQALKGAEALDKVIVVDQSPIGRTPRSNPATYTGLWAPIRELYAMLPQSKARGYKPGRFSFNVKGGRCENCQGDGTLKISMQFLPDVYVACNECHGARFNDETLTVRYKGKNIAELLAMSVEEALGFLSAHPTICRTLRTLMDVGLGYMALGQSSTTLSGGEAQRVKLASELCRRATGRTLYILDEPTTGLHFADVDKLLGVLHRLASGGNTVLVIEHNLEVIRQADWLVDLGPEGGDRGGEVVACGRPADVAKVAASYTGRYLKEASLSV